LLSLNLHHLLRENAITCGQQDSNSVVSATRGTMHGMGKRTPNAQKVECLININD
jgi:hypothetical protein